MEFNYKVYCPTDLDLVSLDDEYTRRGKAIQDILSCSENIFFIEIRGKRYAPKIYTDLNYRPKHYLSQETRNSLVFELTLPGLFKGDLKKKKPDTETSGSVIGSPEAIVGLNSVKNAYNVGYQIFYFLVLTQIAHPGVFTTHTMEVWVDGKFHNYSVDTHSYIWNPYDLSTATWPRLHEIPMLKVYGWLKNSNISFNKISKGRANRAILAVLQIFSTRNYSISHHMMWAMNGLEAIYNTSEDEIAEQMNQHIQYILGEAPSDGLIKPIKNLYNRRSEFAHGTFDSFPLYHAADIEIESVNNYYTKLSNHIRLAILILISTIQEMILREVDHFEFPPLVKSES